MKFIKSTPEDAFNALLIEKRYEKYKENDVPFELPDEYLESGSWQQIANQKISKLQEQSNYAVEHGNEEQAKDNKVEDKKVQTNS